MTLGSGKDRTNYIRNMFAHLAGHYDLANRWMTWSQDVKWRREVINRAHLRAGDKLLDIGAGTGDLALEALRTNNQLLTVGADFTPEMIWVGQNRPKGKSVLWLNADALNLPFSSESFTAVVSGFLLRNVVDVDRALIEQYRVLKPGGRMVCLDTSPPPADVWHFPVRLYLNLVIPIIGGLVAGDIKTYRYLPESTNNFVSAPELVERMCKVGFREVSFRRFMGETTAIHWGIR